MIFIISEDQAQTYINRPRLIFPPKADGCVAAYKNDNKITGGFMKRIVLVDDDANLLKVYKFVLTREGYEVVSCEKAAKALEYISDGKPVDLFILDVELPDMSGLELMEKIREIKQYEQIPIIISSAYEQYKNDFSSWLASDYVVKQSDITGLEAKVKSLLQ
jgi:two-component system response regulator (stage 0 sporulation protein F)